MLENARLKMGRKYQKTTNKLLKYVKT